jgi:hypothetical protein
MYQRGGGACYDANGFPIQCDEKVFQTDQNTGFQYRPSYKPAQNDQPNLNEQVLRDISNMPTGETQFFNTGFTPDPFGGPNQGNPYDANNATSQEAQQAEQFSQKLGNYPESRVPEKSPEKPKKNPFPWMRGFSNLFSFLGNKKARNHQNQYDYNQQTALGVSQFQPTNYNLYAKYGGHINPFSYYSQYGGNLKKLIKEFSNHAQMDMGDGQLDDQGMMQWGGPLPIAQQGMEYINPRGIKRGSSKDSLVSLFNNRVYDNKMKEELGRGMNPYQYNDFLRQNRPMVNWSLGKQLPPNQADTLGQLTNGKYILNDQEFTPPTILPPGVHLMPDGTLMKNNKMAYGGKQPYEIDRMHIMNNILPKLLKMGLLGTGKYRYIGKAKKGGLTPNKAREILHDGTIRDQPITDKQRRFFGAKSKGHTNYRGK